MKGGGHATAAPVAAIRRLASPSWRVVNGDSLSDILLTTQLGVGWHLLMTLGLLAILAQLAGLSWRMIACVVRIQSGVGQRPFLGRTLV